jgi:hypothetical protein
MKFALAMMVVLGSTMTFAKDVKDFNKVLIEDVQKAIETNNDQTLKTNNSPMRGPASVVEEENVPVIKEDLKINNNLGNTKW